MILSASGCPAGCLFINVKAVKQLKNLIPECFLFGLFVANLDG